MKIEEYIEQFIDEDYPEFIDKYLNTKTLNRIKNVTQFCGCDYTKLYNPLILYSRFDHSIVVAHMTWHFTHNKQETIAALLHDCGTPCFAHCIDYVFGDYMNQESSERNIIDIIKNDIELQKYLEEDSINLNEIEEHWRYPILENKSPKLCTDRLDGVLHSCLIWLHTHELDEIKKVYNDITVLTNEEGNLEIGFKTIEIAEIFSKMVSIYAKELQGNTDKFIMKYVSEIVKAAVNKELITLNDLYEKTEGEIISIFDKNFSSWKIFKDATELTKTTSKPIENFYISFETKKRNVIPLIKTEDGNQRLIEVSDVAKQIYDEIYNYHDTKYAYIKQIKEI